MHPRVCLHQVGFLSEPTAAFVQFCREMGVQHMTLAQPDALDPSEIGELKAALTAGGTFPTNMTQPFARHPDLERDTGGAGLALNQAIDAAAALGTRHIYIVSGGRGTLDWEAAAVRLAELIAPCRAHAAGLGVTLSIETANLLNADIHFAHTLDDTIRAAEIAGLDVTIDLGACWFEGGLKEKFARAMPRTRLVQVSDYVPGDRSTPCRAVPGDGMVPLERLLGDLLEAGYEGVFDLELLGPRIAAEGHREAFARAAGNLSELLTKLGA
ncbi:sugar phosphate isomerase/epimerase family protein [Novosphingobium album (ex Hu et al. 2023)]|uniref:Sugar phosphate isomerase/epimerase n=1 Tax=Novosphingobium album (ex Hu et al. 2023) TaxID=2930093 RepID=A0ABT0AZS5_9SPHN|nr:sugar phosphate isomerase/epimerase family protein [Novosphingobium album (ex Hu et al. 2023)]MCJ2178311.1 sugar phosphate isomerase/epimerase [Novosphingobium album (ex Hu et al. 2023)]